MKDNEIKKLVQDLSNKSRLRDVAVVNEIDCVTIEIKTKDGRTLKHIVPGIEMRKGLYILQTVSNCIGFPASSEAKFAAVRSVVNKPGLLLRDYMAGELDWFFDTSPTYRSVYYEMRLDKTYLKLPGNWKHKKDKFYAVGKRKDRYNLELAICDYLHTKKKK